MRECARECVCVRARERVCVFCARARICLLAEGHGGQDADHGVLGEELDVPQHPLVRLRRATRVLYKR